MIANQNQNEKPLPKGVVWIEVAAAAERRCVSGQAIRMLCAKLWGPAGLAKLEKPLMGGKARWLIRTDAHPSLPPIRLTSDIPVSVKGLSVGQQEELERRAKIVADWQAACRAANRTGITNAERLTKEQATELFLSTLKAKHGMELSRRTLHRWYRESRGEAGMGGLIDGRWTQKGGKPLMRADDPFLLEVKRLYLAREERSLVNCHKLSQQTAAKNGWAICSRRTAAAYIERIPEAEKIYARWGAKAYTDKAEAFEERDYSTLAANEIWNSDHHLMDVWVRIGQTIDNPVKIRARGTV